LLRFASNGRIYLHNNQQNKTVLYTGATNNIEKRIVEHKTKKYKNAFSAKYNCDMLVYFETFEKTNEAFLREQQLKSRKPY